MISESEPENDKANAAAAVEAVIKAEVTQEALSNTSNGHNCSQQPSKQQQYLMSTAAVARPGDRAVPENSSSITGRSCTSISTLQQQQLWPDRKMSQHHHNGHRKQHNKKVRIIRARKRQSLVTTFAVLRLFIVMAATVSLVHTLALPPPADTLPLPAPADSLHLQAPADTLLADTVLVNMVTDDTVPADMVTVDMIPTNTLPVGTVLADILPVETLSADTLPADMVPADTASTTTARVDEILIDSASADSSPADPSSADSSPADPSSGDSSPADPSSADPSPADPSPADPSPADPSPADRTTAYLFPSTLPSTYPTRQGACAEDEFSCLDGSRCIPMRWQCDFGRDCHDNSDELSCGKSGCVLHSKDFTQISTFINTKYFINITSKCSWLEIGAASTLIHRSIGNLKNDLLSLKSRKC
ncbi:uncharacterized protein [Procambarus clarkii]|uniref:uncharacterized protein n=1 Tax=Procambarus clarkii TaxID=6728 RepID=UPI0037429AD9